MPPLEQEKPSALLTGRVVQLDARTLDESLITIFRTQLDEIIRNLFHNADNPSTSVIGGWRLPRWLSANREMLQDSFTPLAYFSGQIFTGQSPGQRLMNIRYGNFTKLKGLLNYLLAILLPTTLDTLSRLLQSNANLFHKVIDRITLALKLVNFLYFFYFINQGGTANVIEKAVGLTSIYDQEPSFGQINFSAFNREMLGHSFAQMIILLSPLITIIRRQLQRIMASRAIEKENINRLGQSSDDTIYKCKKCSEKAICAVRARRRQRHYKNREQHQNEGWNIYCFFCYISLFGKSEEMEMEQFILRNTKQIHF